MEKTNAATHLKPRKNRVPLLVIKINGSLEGLIIIYYII